MVWNPFKKTSTTSGSYAVNKDELDQFYAYTGLSPEQFPPATAMAYIQSYKKGSAPGFGMNPGVGSTPLHGYLPVDYSDPTQSMLAQLGGGWDSPLATSVGKYGSLYTTLLSSPEFNQMRGMNVNALMQSPEFQQLQQSTNPEFYVSKGAPAVHTAVQQGRQRGLGALTRGGLRGSGAEAALEQRAGYDTARGMGELSSSAREQAADRAAQVFGLRGDIYGKRRQELGNTLDYRRGVLQDIIRPVQDYKGQGGQQPDWASAAGGIGQGIGALMGLL